MRILYIEDEPADARLVERYIELTPHEIVIAYTLEEAQQDLADSPDLILVDILLGKNRVGYDLVRQLRTQGFTQPMIAVTGLSLSYDIEECYEAGFTDVLTKPYAIQELVAMINKYAD